MAFNHGLKIGQILKKMQILLIYSNAGIWAG